MILMLACMLGRSVGNILLMSAPVFTLNTAKTAKAMSSRVIIATAQ